MSRRFRSVCALVAASSAVFALAGPVSSVSAAAPAAGGGADAVIGSAQLSVTVAKDFPRVVSYTDRGTGAQLLGSTQPVTSVTLNGKAYPVQVKGAPAVKAASAAYTLTFDALPGVEIDATLSVSGRATTFKVTAVRDTAAFRVGTIDIPGHDLVSVGSDEPGAATAFTRLDTDSTRTADVFGKVTDSTAADAAPVGASYAIVNTGQLAAAVESNSSYDKPSGATNGDAARFWHRAQKETDGSVRVGVWSGQWTYRGDGAAKPESGNDLPWAKVVVTPDANGDKKVDWQDGAVAFRSIGIEPKGGNQTPDRVITHIPFNFASQATHPFLRTLDDVKRISLATDGLGQLALLKGYQSEGHDSAHPDYGGNYNTRAGGLTDLNKLLKDGKKWGATFGAHINATEAYPVANHFDDSLVDKTAQGWNWLDQSYYIDQRHDINSGNLVDRLQQLRNETDPNLSLLYLDVYYTHGWIADKTAEAVGNQGWNMASEWGDKFERSSLWSHWANDLDYGGPTNKGLNSKIIRFIRNDEKDVWNNDPVLGQTAIQEFEGWTGETDWTKFYDNVWQRDLPAKYLQHQKITRWDGNDITFTGGVTGTVKDGKRAVYDHGRQVIDGTDYLIPWDGGKKLYHYNQTGGTTSWDVSGAGKYTVYKLTDNGRTKVGTVKPVHGKITLTADAGQPYVLYPDHAPSQADPKWGQDTLVKDPGFNDARLSDWQKTGTAVRDTDSQGRNSAALSGTGTAAVSQQLKGLKPGARYSASAWIEVQPGKSRRTTLSAGGASVAVERSTAKNLVDASDWHGTYFQRAAVNFTAPKNGATTFRIEAAKGSPATVRLDDVRVVANAPTVKAGTVAYEDFENVDQGWGPFLKGDAGGSTDPRTHIAQKHAPYTQAGWNGKAVDDVIGGGQSLKSHEENTGVVYRTAPWTVPMTDGHAYQVKFDYQSSDAGSYAWVDGYDRTSGSGAKSVETRSTPIGEQRTTGHFSENVTAGCGDTFTGLRKLDGAAAGADFVLDNFTVTDLGPASEQAACGTLSVDPAAQTLEPGAKNKVSVTFANDETTAATGVSVSLKLPEGWQAEPAGPVTFDSVAPGAEVTGVWQVTPPVDAAHQPYELSATGTYTVGGATRKLTAATSVTTLPPPPVKDTYASDLDWTSMENGWGPAEKDQENGEQAAGDGKPLTVNGVVFAKGLGTASPGTIRYYLGGQCTSFTAQVGQDASQGTRGSVQFIVSADGTEKVKSPVLKGADDAWSLTADVTGAKYVDLVTGDGGDGPGNDHADWGDARFHCGG
ncbi:endo-alpha-N-acetylgalactosaminidase family protein [Streptomyces sp. NBC_01267]|uniref:endo-alpha-N-acetylgalactosaminidase family protein n=1 Tax=unclassified Streptomyces TaxID=2593676 RepID=UPI002DD828B0|nr:MULTISPECIES: endo-alpha-N-acetylgalactosaminidase family protein [unclassified Streptomyces]WSC19628.1 endo-alpha-N-acetylgalactosaminidase family protein [Streptomyces sp. NBC_01766]